MRYIVGYAPNKHGAQAVALASALALTQGAELEIVHVLDGPRPSDTDFAEERMVQDVRTGRVTEWLRGGADLVPDGVTAHTRLVYADSIAEGLIEAARELNAALIVVSAARAAPLNRFMIGSVANSLLHAAHVPVALVPSGYEQPEKIIRMTAAIGSREGARTLLDVVLAAATRRGVPLRLVSLVSFDHEGPDDSAAVAQSARDHAREVLDEAVKSVGAQAQVTAVVAEGSTIEDAAESLPWDDGEVAIIGSSRLAEHRKIFMGSTANKILRVLPIPLIVVPRSMPADAPLEL
ncbi:MAG: universal stress protein [Allobranchiibius sp.]